MPKKKAIILPNKLLFLPNPDKEEWAESWYPGRNLLSFPANHIIILCGTINSGKTSCILNIIARATPQYEEIYLFHCDPEYTKEYEILNIKEIYDKVPEPNQFNNHKKKLLIIDDAELSKLSNQEEINLKKLYRFSSSHCNLNIMLTTQDFYHIPFPLIRRLSNVIILWESMDRHSFISIAGKIGLKVEVLKGIFKNFMDDPRDSLWVDMTIDTPYKFRKNGFILIKVEKL